MENTLVIVKPDGDERGLLGEILSRFERRGLKIVEGRLGVIDKETAQAHYQEHVGKDFFDDLVSFITRSPSFVCIVQGPEGTFKIVRDMMGTTNPKSAPSGTIRGDFGTDISENLIHGSDSLESASREIGIFFPK